MRDPCLAAVDRLHDGLLGHGRSVRLVLATCSAARSALPMTGDAQPGHINAGANPRPAIFHGPGLLARPPPGSPLQIPAASLAGVLVYASGQAGLISRPPATAYAELRVTAFMIVFTDLLTVLVGFAPTRWC